MHDVSLVMKEKEIEPENEKLNENVFLNKSSFNHNEIEHATSTPKEKKGNIELFLEKLQKRNGIIKV